MCWRFVMPVLHRYKEKPGYYAKTRIQSAIVTFQLTEEGSQQLIEAGVGPAHFNLDAEGESLL